MDGIAALAGLSGGVDFGQRVQTLEKQNQEFRTSMYLAEKLENSHLNSMPLPRQDHLCTGVHEMSISD